MKGYLAFMTSVVAHLILAVLLFDTKDLKRPVPPPLPGRVIELEMVRKTPAVTEGSVGVEAPVAAELRPSRASAPTPGGRGPADKRRPRESLKGVIGVMTLGEKVEGPRILGSLSSKGFGSLSELVDGSTGLGTALGAGGLGNRTGEPASLGTGGERPTTRGGLDPRAVLSAHLAARARRCYPAAARRFTLAGTVELEFRLDAAGQLESSGIRTSSGFGTLDEAALRCVLRGAEPLPPHAGSWRVPVVFEASDR